MKFLKHTLSVMACVAMVATAQAEMKMGTVDMQKLFKDYYKTHESQKEIDKARLEVQNKNQERLKRIEEIQAELQNVQKQAEDPSLSESARKELSERFNVLKNEMSALDQERRSFIERKTRVLQEQMGRTMQSLLKDVNDVVEAIAKDEKYDFLFDKSAIGVTQTRTVLYSTPSIDITEKAMAKLNAEAPAGFDPNANKSEEEGAPAIPAAATPAE